MPVSDLSIVGPVGIREMTLPAVCEAHEGHTHNYDHATIVISGRVKVQYVLPGGTEGESREFGPGEAIAIKANVKHTLKALEENTKYLCVFSHRNFNGLVTQEYTGNQAAYH